MPPSPALKHPPIDFTRHNAEARAVWEAYYAGKPIRVPVGNYTIGPRIWLLDPTLNTQGITWEAFHNDPAVMFDLQLRYKDHLHHHVIQDAEMGIPANGWEVFVEFVNIHEANWLGCDIQFAPGQVPATIARYQGDRKREIFDRGMPEPFDGIYGQVKSFYEYFLDRAARTEFKGKPVRVTPPWVGTGTDGLLTVALDVRGGDIFADMLDDPDYYHELMSFILEATIRKVRAWRKYLGVDPKPAQGWIADDAIQLISTEVYRELVLPYHRRLVDELFSGGPHIMHLCGHVQRHLPTIVRELGVNSFDTGFPINFETLRDEVGEDVHISGGVHVATLLNGTPEQVRAETRRILTSGITRGGKFVIKEANNMPPGVPPANLWAMYETTREFGRYP